jgi:hypothetical protein
VIQIFVRTVRSMGSVVSVGVDTERKKNRNAKLLYKLKQEKEELMMAERARAAKEGPRPLEPRGEKRKADKDLVDQAFVPKFCRGYVWGDSNNKNMSPSALYTETAPPLPSPPDHLVNDPIIQRTTVSGQVVGHPQ